MSFSSFFEAFELTDCNSKIMGETQRSLSQFNTDQSSSKGV